MYASILTQQAATFFIDGAPVTFHAPSDQYSRAVAIHFDAQLTDAEKIDKLRNISVAVGISLAAAAKKLSENVDVNNLGSILYRGYPVPQYIALKLKELVDAGLDYKPLAAFVENLMQNASNDITERLYEFLEFGKIPITPDGCFLAYKAVRPDFKDIHSGTFDNSVGRVCEMPRNQVDEDHERTCSRGLHVCSWDYLPHFSHANGHVMICKVNPRDVVAIPTDYNNTKMRVCRYEVVDEYKGYYEKNPHNLLASRLVFDDYDGNEVDIDDTEYENEAWDDDLTGDFTVRAYDEIGRQVFLLQDVSEDTAWEVYNRLKNSYSRVMLFNVNNLINISE